jgi:ATP-dependent exoDNAse (exonuclease V) beta subunit
MTRAQANAPQRSPQSDPRSLPQGAPRRRWIGWDKPVLPNVAQQLLDDYARGDTWDMRHLLLVLPGGLARRRLHELLALLAKQHHKILYPPRIVTLGTLPEQLYVAKYPFASDLIQQLAWVKALRTTPTAELTQVVPVPPAKSAAQAWLELAKMLSGLHRELASDGLNFERVVDHLGAHSESTRWQALARIQARYLATLDAQQLWDIQTARLCALQFREPSTDQQIIVIGCVDLNRTQRGFIEQVAEQVAVWIAAPETAQELFDEYGSLHGETWQDYQIEIADDALLVGNSPTDQAELTCAVLAEFGARYHVREVTLGVPDPSLIRVLQHHLDQAGIQARFGPGSSLAQSEPATLLALIGQFVDSRSFPAFAALVRHPAVAEMLVKTVADLPADWLASIDKYYPAALPKQVDEFVNSQAPGAKVYTAVAAAVDGWLRPLNSRTRTISKWVHPLLDVMSSAYAGQIADQHDPLQLGWVSAAQAVSQAIHSLTDIPQGLEPVMSVSELIDWLAHGMNHVLVPAPTSDSAVEMLGWLELSLDDAPALVITGVHDGVVPESSGADSFLPNALRRQLGMMDNTRRYARDMYALQVMLQSREQVRIVVGKTDINGDPLVPSRLLMACDLAKLPDRVLHLVKEEEVDCLPAVASRWTKRGGPSELLIPRPTPGLTVPHMTVTAFRSYLACPYRFYLGHVLKLRSEQDAQAELDAPMFGNLVHDTLELLGKGSMATSTDAQQIEEFLLDSLRSVAASRYGPSPPAAVLIQIEQAEQRLKVFAPLQAARAQAGWEIRFTECAVTLKDQVLLGEGAQLPLIGRIDRIDYHPASNRWAIWDYKTSDNAKHPLAVHWSKKEGWMDLQLPLYRPLSRIFGVENNPSVGYIALPKQASDIGFHTADFTPEQLLDADRTAHRIATRIAQGEFWPEPLGEAKYDDFARICQSNVQRVAVDPPPRTVTRHQALQHQIPPPIVAAAHLLLAAGTKSQPRFDPLLIRASAGTGKTFQLTNRLLQIILSGQEVDPILASTFTRKAAGEIMHRVLQRLAQSCLHEHARHEMSRHLPDVDSSAAACLAALRRVTRSIHRLRIGTLDSFFAQVARTFSLEMGLPPGWSPLDPVQEPLVQLQAIGQMLDNHDGRTLVDLVRMLSKGDSGRQVSDQIRQTVASGFNAYRATSAEAWDQLPVPAAPSEVAVESALQTVEQTQILNKSGSVNRSIEESLKKLHLLARSGDWEQVINHGIFKSLADDPPTYYKCELDSSLIAALQVLAERAAAELLAIRRNQTLASHKILQAYDAEYSSMIRGRRALAFADVTYFLARWMAGEGPLGGGAPASGSKAPKRTTSQRDQATLSTSRLAFRLDCGVEHLLLDEFQDTAPEQWQILRPLAAPLGGAPSSQSSFFCVGDTKQAIYGWRGGVAEIFNSVGQTVSRLQQSAMSDSYRSSPQVMQVVNQVFTNLTRHDNFAQCEVVAEQWSRQFPEHRTSRQSLKGFVRLQNGPKLDSGTSVEQRKELYLKIAAEQIAQLTQACSASVGVLFRTNADVGRMIALLRELGVSASQDGGNPLSDSAAVELMLSLIHLADHPGDGICAFHVGTSPLADKIPYSAATQPHLLAAWIRIQVARQGLGKTVESLADHIANRLGWWDQHRLSQFIQAAYDYEPHFTGRMREFEEAILRTRVALPTEAQVKVMTIHKSKGLEFDAVFLPELDIELSSSNSLLVLRGSDPCQPPDGVIRYMNSSLQAMLPEEWQAAFALHKQRGVNEALCMLYVAMTRARQALYMLTRPTSRGALQEFGSLLQSTLVDEQVRSNPDAILYELGDPHWYRTENVRPPELPRTNIPQTAPGELHMKLRTDLDSAPQRGLRVTAPSQLDLSQGDFPLSQAFSHSYSQGSLQGSIIHAFFEHVAWLDEFRLDSHELRRVALSTLPPETLQHVSIDQSIDEFSKLLQLASVRKALSKSRYLQPVFGQIPDRVEIDRERTVSLVVERQLVSGTIDRLVVLFKNNRPYAAEIFDFKTDQVDSNLPLLWLNERVRHHGPQLEIYAQVVAELFDLPREQVQTYLLMLAADRCIACRDGLRMEQNDLL